jgi:uncharacterized membrane protein YcaP (DUF421 family)
MGKREIGKLSVFDLVISIMIAEIAVFVLEDANKPLSEGLLPIGVLVVLEIGIAYISLKNRKIREWFDGPPSIIIRNGRLNRTEMKKQKYNLDDLLLQLRQNNITNIADVEFAILETTGKLTVVEKNKQGHSGQTAAGQKETIAQAVRRLGMPLPLIMDGKVQENNLRKIGKNHEWLEKKIRERGAKRTEDVFFCSVDYNGELYVSLMDE